MFILLSLLFTLASRTTCEPIQPQANYLREVTESARQHPSALPNSFLAHYHQWNRRDSATGRERGDIPITQTGSPKLNTFMKTNPDKYFECTVLEPVLCCDDCRKTYSEDGCKFCDEAKSCNETKYINVTEKCPPSREGRGIDGWQTVHFVLKEPELYYADLKAFGIDRNSVGFQNVQIGPNPKCSTHNDANYQPCGEYGWWFNFPKANSAINLRPHGLGSIFLLVFTFLFSF